MVKVNTNDLATHHRDPHIFYAIWKDFIEEFALGVSYEEFKNTIKTLEEKPSSIIKLYEKQKTYLINELNQDIHYMWEESQLADKYKVITKLIDEAKEKPDKVAWRPITGNCEHHLHVYRKNGLKEKKRKLEELIQILNEMQALIQKQVKTKQNLIMQQLKKISDAEAKISEFSKYYCEYLKEFNSNENNNIADIS